MLKIRTLLNGPVEENCYLLSLEGSKGAILIDPGSSPQQLMQSVAEAGLKPELILATHAHFDHVGAVQALAEAYSAPFAMHAADKEMLETLEDTYMFYGMGSTKKPKLSRELKDGEMLEAAGIRLKCLHTPGHTPGGLCYYHEESASLFSGDTLFSRSIGRSDFEGGDGALLVESIRQKLLALPEGVTIYPGHGGTSTIGLEKRENPFLR
jgi:glyoxylase-like metal-dependent hydrolase (beta-lactamase superfamily II)